MRSCLGVLVVLALGCANEDVASRGSAVHNGVTSADDGVVFVYAGGSSCGGVMVGDRWVLALSFCTEAPVRVVTSTDEFAAATTVHRGPLAPGAGGAEVFFDLIELEAPLSEPAAELSTTTPEAGDLLPLVGYGSRTGYSPNTKTRGDFRLLGTETDAWFFEATGELEVCSVDAAVLDESDDLLALAAFITYPDGTEPGSCSTSFGAAPITEEVRTFIADTIEEATSPRDAGAPDSGIDALDSGIGADGGAEPSSDDDGCSCRAPGGSHSPMGALPVVAALWLGLRRRRAARGR